MQRIAKAVTHRRSARGYAQEDDLCTGGRQKSQSSEDPASVIEEGTPEPDETEAEAEAADFRHPEKRRSNQSSQ